MNVVRNLTEGQISSKSIKKGACRKKKHFWCEFVTTISGDFRLFDFLNKENSASSMSSFIWFSSFLIQRNGLGMINENQVVACFCFLIFSFLSLFCELHLKSHELFPFIYFGSNHIDGEKRYHFCFLIKDIICCFLIPVIFIVI